ncbi:Sulfotransferase domain-containing protein [Sinosporangium album]|uniref:Sulfotransferase domain-containing protein n=1 Tax=Sinosporangium album TaxID=504805 RepID=A0A1G8AJ08_9ACTN|nr:sulfotransferase domain-containing protein [Sinosporangium album]SDH20796.1 Sulfotransferase domain-containing protein [Sinosporangium album]
MNPTVKRSVHAVSRTTGRITSAARILPSFMITGAQRCGTTSLYRALSQHPLMLKPVLHKGVHYFDVNYAKGLSWYRAHFPLEATVSRLQRRYGIRPQAFESSPYYLFHPLATARIGWDLPGVKLIVLVRDPVERARSAHAHELARGFEHEASFERAVALEEERLQGEEERVCASPNSVSLSHRHHAYLGRGRYAHQLARLDPLIGPDRVLVLDSHRFFADPAESYDRVLHFLGLPHMGDPVFERHNARSRPSEMPESLRTRLYDHFEPWDSMLTTWLGTTPSWRM